MGRLNCVCIDKSEQSAEAFDWYVAHHHREGDVVGLIHIHQMPQLPSMGLMAGSLPVTEDFHQSVKKSVSESKEIIEKFAARCRDQLKCEYKVLAKESHHSPGQLICEIAESNGADVIVMGQRGLNSFSRALLGSTSDYVLHHADLTVIVVPFKKST